jgi:hypothetical protein
MIHRAIVGEASRLHLSSDFAEQWTNGMTITSAVVLALGATGWKSVGGQLLASGVLLLSGHQDIGLRARMGAAFGFFMAIAFGISALVTAMRGNLWYAAAICVAVLCSETLLILRWWIRRTSA